MLVYAIVIVVSMSTDRQLSMALGEDEHAASLKDRPVTGDYN
jgi:hypothetical protein